MDEREEADAIKIYFVIASQDRVIVTCKQEAKTNFQGDFNALKLN